MSANQSAISIEDFFFSKILRWRYAKVLILSTFINYIVSSIFCNLLQLIVTDGIFNPFIWINQLLLIFSQPFALLYGICISTLPFIVLTRLHITSFSMQIWVPVKRIHYIAQIFHPRVLGKSVILTLLCGYLSFRYASLADPTFSKFYIKCVTGDGLCLNHQPFVIFLFGILFGVQFSLLYFTNNRNVVLFEPGAPSTALLIKSVLNWRFLLASCSSFNFGIWTILVAPSIYMFNGLLYYDCIGGLIGYKPNADECVSLFSLATDVSLWLVLILTAVLLSFVINAFLTLFQKIVSQPLFLSIGGEEVFNAAGSGLSILNLASGLKSNCVLLKLLSLRYLRDISTDSSPWGKGYQKKAFAISQPGGHPHNWQGILTPTLSLIKEFTNKLKNLNNPKVNPILTAQGSTNMPSSRFAKQREIVKVENNLFVIKQRVLKVMYDLLEIPLIKFFISPLPDAENIQIISDGQAVIWAVQGLSHLVSTSYTADEYGVVQRDLVDILTSLTQLQQVLDLSLRSNSLRVGYSSNQINIDTQLRKGLRVSIRMALYLITNTFKDGLRDLSLSGEVREKLESYLTFQEG